MILFKEIFMGCGCGGKKVKEAAKQVVAATKNLVKASIEQPDKIRWFKDGLTGILKCIDGQTLYSDEVIVQNRNICRECEFSSKTDGKLTATSQCMAVDPETGAPCGCFIICKTQTGKCPVEKWANLTISVSKTET
jgi:hypothetical protein